MVSQFTLAVNRAPRGSRIVALVDDMIRRFGGLENFARAWADQIDRARENRPGSKRILDAHRCIVRLMELCTDSQPDPTVLTDADLAQHMLVNVEHLVVEQPELVLRVAEALGWTVTKPG